uniref:BTB domain-containing protein n=1 Tax=Branchiostoma floridae TaxID=7739 RepID=C3ZBQ3_BRAFL|eukprot:XP_002594279.1 hypothetical protein BRAFLDRAFT_57016 [Branchiostoma floridae]
MAAGQRSPASSDFCHQAHAGALLQGLEGLRSNSLLVDVILCVAGKEIPCHRNVLAACSGYFQAMFCNGLRESKEHKVTIHEVSASIMQLLVDYAYTSKVTITKDNAVELLEGANFFQIQPVFDACTKFLSKHLCAENCLKMLALGGMLAPDLEKKALPCAMKEFDSVSKTPEFLCLRKEQLITLISSDDLNASEETVYTAVMAWINHDTRGRRKEMKELMELVRFPFMDRLYFLENVENNNAVRKACLDIVAETRKYQLFPGEVQSPRTRPRRASGLKEAVVVIGGREVPGSGFCGRLSFSDVWLYNVELNNWADLAPLNVTRHYHKLAVLQGKVYAIGGRDNSSKFELASVEVYDRNLNKWSEGVPLPEPRSRHAVAVLDGSIYVIGGCNDELEPKSTVYCFSPGDAQWQPQSDVPVVGRKISASVLNGNIYVAVNKGIYSFRPGDDGGSWSEVLTCGVNRSPGMTVIGGKLYLYGGKDRGVGSTYIMCLDPETKSLLRVGTMPVGLYGHACVTVLKG